MLRASLNRRPGWIIVLCAGICLGGVAAVLHLWGAIEVRTSLEAVLGLTFIGALWLLLAVKIFP
jgi:hypothetical protein